MTKNTLRLLVAFLVFSSTSVAAEDSCEGFLAMPSSSLVSNDKMQLGIDCLKASIQEFQEVTAILEEEKSNLEETVDRLISSELTNRTSDYLIPSGAVVAFSALHGCPHGWEKFSPADGRTIIGVDGNKYKLPYLAGSPEYQTGGEETHLLTEDEMPRHRHSVKYSIGGTSPGQGVLYLLANAISESATAYVGGGKPHNNLQPYIALYYCIKD